MKKLIYSIIILVICLTILVSCNVNLGLGAMKFNYVYIKTQNSYKCYEIASWRENDVGVEVKLKNGTSLFIAEGLYILSTELVEGLTQ